MAKQLNINYSRIIKTAIMHTIENGRRFNSHGAMLSLRSPQRREIINEINPVVANEGNRLSHTNTTVGGVIVPVAQVTLQWRPQRPANALSTTRRNKADLISNANNESTVLEDTITYDIHNEYSEGFTQVQMMKLEPIAEQYLNSVNKGLNINNKGNAMWQGLAEVGERIFETIDNSIFDPLNLSCTANLIAGIGKNLVDGTTAANIPTIALFNDRKQPLPDLIIFLENIRRKHQLKNKKLIVVGGSLLTEWVAVMEMSAVQDLGLDSAKMLSKMPFEFYYDSNIDTNYGQDKIIVSDPGAAALEFVQEHKDVIKANKVGDTTFTTATMSMMGFDTATTTIEMDLRIVESDSGPYPQIYVAPSVRAGIYTRPPGAIKTYGGFEDQTGIWGIQLVRSDVGL